VPRDDRPAKPKQQNPDAEPSEAETTDVAFDEIIDAILGAETKNARGEKIRKKTK
jgi:hypothetical protein